MVVWPSGIFHRIISGDEGSISVNFSTRNKKFSIEDNFNIYDLNIYSGETRLLKDGYEDQPDLNYEYPNEDIKRYLQLFNHNIAQYNKIITERYSLDNIKEPIEAMKRGETPGRILIEMK